MALHIGIDGCRGGWLFSIIGEDGEISIVLFSQLIDAVDIIKKAERIFIDMPIGLVDNKNEKRIIDNQIRTELGYPFSSSVFTVPCRQAVYADNYKEALEINKAILGKGFSIQSWNICPKIKELDIFLEQNIEIKGIFVETHPELRFKQVNGESLQFKKKTVEGFNERINLLKIKYPSIVDVYLKYRKQFLKKDVSDDDMLDSLILTF